MFTNIIGNLYLGGQMLTKEMQLKNKIIIVKQISLKDLNKLESLGYKVYITGGKS